MRQIWQAFVDEPLIPFALIGGVLFVIYGFRHPQDDVETIEIRSGTVRALESLQEELLGRPLTDDEKQDVLEGLVEEEVLLREAYRRELEKKDSRVRKRLLTVMRSTLDQPVSPPSRAELQSYFDENREQFVTGETITFDHLFFSFGSEEEPDDPLKLLTDLRAGMDHTQLGEVTFFGRVMRDRSKDELRRMLGAEFAERAFSFPLGQWQGPVESQSGVHFLRLTERREPQPPTFEQMEDYLRQDWMFRKRRALQNDKIAEMRKQYRIVYSEDK